MKDDSNTDTKPVEEGGKGFFPTLLMSLARDAVRLVVAFAVGTGAGAIVCWYYGIPLVFSLLGGILVLGLAVAFWSDSPFS